MKHQSTITQRQAHDPGVDRTGLVGRGAPAQRPSATDLDLHGRKGARSVSPSVLLRIQDGAMEMRRSFTDFAQAVDAAEAYAMAGFQVGMISATGHFLMEFQPRWPKMAV